MFGMFKISFFVICNFALGLCWKCGVPSAGQFLVFNKIINGEDAFPNSWPWMISLRTKQNNLFLHLCGGSILDETTILTAAHCISEPEPSLFVVVGAHEYDGPFDNHSIYSISKAYIHPNYDENEIRNDISILKLNRPISFSNKVYPVCLPSSSNMSIIYEKKVVVIGWGLVTEPENETISPSVLQKALLKVINNSSVCSVVSNYNPSENYCLIEDMLSPDTNICNGDSGGPMLYFDGEKWIVFGVASFVVKLLNGQNSTRCSARNPSFYASVPVFLNYIKNFTTTNISTHIQPSEFSLISIIFAALLNFLKIV
jgi:plasminogen